MVAGDMSEIIVRMLVSNSADQGDTRIDPQGHRASYNKEVAH